MVRRWKVYCVACFVNRYIALAHSTVVHNNYLLSEEVSLVYADVLVSEALPCRRVR